MSSRTTWTMLLAATGLFAFIFFFERHLHPAAELNQPGRVLPDLKIAAVTNIIIRPAGSQEISAIRTNTAWQLTKPISYPAQAASVETLLQAFDLVAWHTRITAEELKDRPQSDHEFGFDAPQFSLVIQQGDREWQLKIGSRTPFGDEVYFQVVGRAEIYLVSAALLQYLPHSVSDWRDPDLVDLKNFAFDHLAVTNGTKAFELQRDETNRLWRVVRPLEARADNPKIEHLLQQLQELRFSEFVTDDPKADLESYGLQPPGLELAFAHGDDPVLDLQFGKSPTNDPGQIFVRRANTASIGLVAKDQLAGWLAPFEAFRDHHLVTLAGNSVSELEVHAADNFILRRQTNDTWRIVVPVDLPADTALVRQALGALGGMEVVQFVKSVVTEPDLPSYGLAPPARQFILKSGSGATNSVIAQLDFGTTQGDNVFVRRTDESAVYAVPAVEFKALPSESWRLRDRRLWDFTEADVTKLTLRQNGNVLELLHLGTNQWAFAAGSQGVMDSFRVEEAVGTLGEMSAAFWTARGDSNRARYGFAGSPPSVSVDVKRGDKTETLTLELGGVAPSQLRYAATTLAGETWIFELPVRTSEVLHSYLPLPGGP